MNAYELMIIYNPQLSDNEVAEAVEKSKKIILDEKGEIAAEDKLGRKKFYHQIVKNRDGFYVYLKVKAAPESLKSVSRQLKLQQNVLRSMTIRSVSEASKA